MTTQCQDIRSIFTLLDADTEQPVMGERVRLKGCSVSLGIGAGSSTITLDLVADTCTTVGGVKVYEENDIALPSTGTPVIFTCNNLVFGGIISSLIYTENNSGFDYKVVIIDPKKVLEGVTVLLKGYYCDPIPGVIIANFVNMNKLLEEDVAKCPPRQDFENWPDINNCTNFGNAGGSQGPFLWAVLEKIQAKYNGVLGAFGDAFYTTSARRIYVNLSDLVSLLKRKAPYARTNQANATLTDLIDAACNLIACDYTILLEKLAARVYIIDRTVPPPMNVIKTLVTDSQTSGKLISGSIGRDEIYLPSNRIVLGDNVQYLAELVGTVPEVPEIPPDPPGDLGTPGVPGVPGVDFAMMLGYDLIGEPVRAFGPNFTVEIDIRPIKDILINSLGRTDLPDMFPITEEEILCSGSLIAWRTFGLKDNTLGCLCDRVHDGNNLGFGGRNDGALAGVINAMANLLVAANPLIPIGAAVFAQNCWVAIQGQAADILLRQANEIAAELAIYEWFNNFINAYYGTHWLIPLAEPEGARNHRMICITPLDNITKVESGDRYTLSDEPIEAGYPSPTQLQNGILGLGPGVDTSLFETGDGKISGFGSLERDFTNVRILNEERVIHEIFMGKTDQSNGLTIGRILYQKIETKGTVYKNTLTNTPEILITTPFISMVPQIGPAGLRISNVLRAAQGIFGLDVMRVTNEITNKKSLNVFKVRNAAAGFQKVVIPMKSNIYVYGPWTSTNAVVGSTTIIPDESLNPWTCGGYLEMNTIGQSLADQGIRYSNSEESGSITLAELPGYSINYFLNLGISLDSIVLNYGSGGATTTYSFKQYVQKFGSYQQTMSNMIKKNAAERNQILGGLRKQRLEKIFARNSIQNTLDLIKHPEEGASPGFCLVGRYGTPKQTGLSNKAPEPHVPTPRSECACPDQDPPDPKTDGALVRNSHSTDIHDANDWGSMSHTVEGDLQNYAALSLDAVFAPVSMYGRDNRLPRYATGLSDKILCKSRPSMPPIDQHGFLDIYQPYLNPIINKTELDLLDDRINESDVGVYITRISFGTKIVDVYNALGGDPYDEAEDFGFFALKGPLVLQSWGYDTQGKPIPNQVDVETKACAGSFAKTRLTNKFMKNWLGNPRTWPVAPIDLRYDRDRGVWVSPPADRIVVARLSEALFPNKTAKAELLNPDITTAVPGERRDFLDGYVVDGMDGEDLVPYMKKGASKVTIIIDDYLGVRTEKGTIVYAMRNDQRYIILGSKGLNPGMPRTVVEETPPSGPDKGNWVIKQYEKDSCADCAPTKDDKIICPTDACGLSDCIKDLYGRTLLPVVTTPDLTTGLPTKKPPFKESTSVTIPWGGTKVGDNYVGPFGRELPTNESFASGVLGIDGNGCLKIYPLTSCGIVDPPVTTTINTTPPGGSTAAGGTSTTPTTPVAVPVPTPQTPPVAVAGAIVASEDSGSGFAQNGGNFVVDPPYVFPTPEDICAGVGVNSDGIMGPGGYNDYLDCVRRETEKRFALIRAAQGRD